VHTSRTMPRPCGRWGLGESIRITQASRVQGGPRRRGALRLKQFRLRRDAGSISGVRTRQPYAESRVSDVIVPDDDCTSTSCVAGMAAYTVGGSATFFRDTRVPCEVAIGQSPNRAPAVPSAERDTAANVRTPGDSRRSIRRQEHAVLCQGLRFHRVLRLAVAGRPDHPPPAHGYARCESVLRS
jgi:hypothetical protein